MAKMKRSWSLLSRRVAPLLLVASISGCSYLEQAQDNAPMTSVMEVKRAQTMNPAASANRKAVAGLSGQASQNVSEGYANSFKPKEGGGANELYQGLQGVGGGQ